MTLDLDHLRQWIGRRQEAEDLITAQLVKAFRALLNQEPGEPAPGEAAPLAIHWCLAPPTARMAGLGPDGHQARGEFLPPVPLPRRMWAGGAIESVGALRVGERVRRLSEIEDVTLKQGRSGPLCFVGVRHDYVTERGLALRERHDIVYREMTAAESRAPNAEQPGDLVRSIDPTPTLLFRYSAVTYNGHRIHYDQPYATQVEGYPGLVVHGPLQATLLLHLAAELKDGRAPRHFRYRGVSPLFAGTPFQLHGRLRPDGTADCWTQGEGSRIAMTAEASW